MALAEFVEPLAAFDGEACFERVCRVIKTGVDHTAVVRARFHPEPRVPLDHADGAAEGANLGRGGQPYHTAANHETSIVSMRERNDPVRSILYSYDQRDTCGCRRPA